MDDTIALIRKSHDGDKKAREELVEKNIGLIWCVVKRFYGRGAEPEKVYSNGYSGGGETLALILGKKPELFTAALMCSSKWDGVYEPVTEAKTPVYFVIGESDEYYGSEPFKEAYQILYELYAEQGLAKSEIDNLLVLDIKEKNYFAGTKVTYQHGGGYLFCRDEKIMGWLFGH